MHPPQEIKVVCKGQPKPDMFAAGRDVIVEGHLTGHNLVSADQVMTSCPSKYRPKKAYLMTLIGQLALASGFGSGAVLDWREYLWPAPGTQRCSD